MAGAFENRKLRDNGAIDPGDGQIAAHGFSWCPPESGRLFDITYLDELQ